MDILHANDYMMAQTHIRLFHRLFYKLSLFYASNVPKTMRTFIDRLLMIQAGICIFLLFYVHRAFLHQPGTCVDPYIDDWPRAGVFRVQINTTVDEFYSIPIDSQDVTYVEEKYIMEYSLHYSFLRMSEELRNNLTIQIYNVTLEKDNPCFGNLFSRFLLENLFGYDDVLMGSFKKLAANVSNKGYLRNVVTGEHYRFIDIWLNKLNYVLSFVVMIILTSVIAMLMRLCHHQLFKFFCKLLFALQNHVLYPVWMPFPIASLITMFLGLWGLETIMTELLDDPMVSFHLIAFVWMADNYYTICCHNQLSKKHFPRFFYLASYMFYAFHNQFNGQFSGLALFTTFMTTQLCMVYFYHKYEVPIIEFFVSRSRAANAHNHPVNIEAMVTSLIQLQQNNYVTLEPYNTPPYQPTDHGLRIHIMRDRVYLSRAWRLLIRILRTLGLFSNTAADNVNDTDESRDHDNQDSESVLVSSSSETRLTTSESSLHLNSRSQQNSENFQQNSEHSQENIENSQQEIRHRIVSTDTDNSLDTTDNR